MIQEPNRSNWNTSRKHFFPWCLTPGMLYEFQLKHYFLNNTLNYIEFYTDFAICDFFRKISYAFMSISV